MRDPDDVHGRRPALLDRPGRRAEHADARRRARTGATARRSRGRSGSTRCASASPRPCEEEIDRLLDAIAPAGRGRAAARARRPARRRGGHPRARPRGEAGTAEVLGWYDAIVASVTEITAGHGADRGRRRVATRRCATRWSPALGRAPESSLLAAAAGDAGGLSRDEVISNAAVLLFGGIETTEGMIASAIAHLLAHPDAARRRPRGAGAARQRDRGVAAAGARGGGHRPLHDARDVAFGGAAIGAARAGRGLDRGREPRPGGLPRPGPLRRPAAEREAPRGVRGRPARLHRDAPGPAGGARRGGGRARAAAGPASSPATRPRAGSCSASRRRCGCAGPPPAVG